MPGLAYAHLPMLLATELALSTYVTILKLQPLGIEFAVRENIATIIISFDLSEELAEIDLWEHLHIQLQQAQLSAEQPAFSRVCASRLPAPQPGICPRAGSWMVKAGLLLRECRGGDECPQSVARGGPSAGGICSIASLRSEPLGSIQTSGNGLCLVLLVLDFFTSLGKKLILQDNMMETRTNIAVTYPVKTWWLVVACVCTGSGGYAA
ncbi:hypothetical protein ACRRTK_015039 [Alexandromys fortis]